MSRSRKALLAAGSLALVGLAAIGAAILVVRSDWFYEKVRERIVETVETATGGRAALGAFRFDAGQLRVDIRDFTLRGTEPATKPPLVHASSITIGLKIISLFRRDVDIQYVDVRDPHIYLIIYPDGRTNVPSPKIKKSGDRNAIETLIKLTIARFSLQNGIFELDARGKTPFTANGRNLDARFLYELGGPRYRGDVSIQPLDVDWGGQERVPFGVQMAVTLEKNRIGISSARFATGMSTVDLSGAIDDLISPRISLSYDARASAADASRIFHIRGLQRGAVQVGGNAEWSGPQNYSVTGNLHAVEVDFQQLPFAFRNFRGDGALRAAPEGVNISGLRLSGEAVNGRNRVPVNGRISEIGIRGSNLDLRGTALGFLGGAFRGDMRVENLDRFRVVGEINGLEARRAVTLYSREPLPWDSLISGMIDINASLRRGNDLRASANLMLAPAAQGPPVHGQIAATYDARTGALELRQSALALPNSRIDVSGSVGRTMRIHLETRDLNDFLPVLGQSAASLPVKLESGSAVFDGTTNGQPGDPQIAGHVALTRFSYSGKSFDALQADINASSQNVRFQNGALARGTLRAQFQLSVGLQDWKTGDSSPISGNGSVHNASLPDLIALLDQKPFAATGLVDASGQIAGTIGSPQINGDLNIAKGSFEGEPFDRFTGRVSYTDRAVQLASGRLNAGSKQARVEASFDHPAGSWESGRLRFQAQSNAMPLDQIATLEKVRPGVKGTIQLTASGAIDLLSSGGKESFRIADLQADIAGRSLQLTGQPLGDAHLTASSQGAVLRAHLDSDFADSAVRGDGEWKLEGDYPGSATVTFSRVNLTQLQAWLAPTKSEVASRITGAAEGELRLSGPALKPELIKAELRLPTLEIGPAPGTEIVPGAGSFALRNSGPIVASVANSVVTIESARLMGRSTDITVGGRVLLQQKNALDLRVNGKLDLAVLQDFNRNLNASGIVTSDTTVRGALDAPQINGRLELQNASLNYSDFPNGIANANGVIVFSGERATIQSLTAETGGGKLQLFGFAGYSGSDIVFRVHANADAVRVRYPEGVSTVANADLNFSGTTERSELSGTVTVLRTGFNLESDFSSLLAKSAEPVRVPSARAGFAGGVNFDIQLQTSPDIEFESALTQGLQADANLRLRGTPYNPALLGRINITQGQVVFFGTKYVINQGSVAFYNPVKIEPVLDVDLETKARGIDITLTVAGPLNKLNVTPRSDPPLQFNEIVSLLATGRTPSSADPALLSQQNAPAQPFQQSAATALLGQVIANPVSGRLQRFFGISKLRIDPTLPGIEYNPQARLTLEQQVTPDITFTYITNITSANPQVVSVEWSVSKKWSVVALREENGLVGLDFFYKRRFK